MAEHTAHPDPIAPGEKARKRALALLAPLFAMVLLVQGCAPGTAGADDPWSQLWGGGGASPGQGSEGFPEDEGSPEDEGGQQPAAGIGSAGKACLTGTWLMDNSSFEAMLQQILATAPDVPTEFQGRIGIKVIGASYMRFDGGTGFTAWQEGFGMQFDGGAMTITHAQDSRDTGSYDADDEHVWVHGLSTVSLQATMEIGDLGKVELDSSSPGMATVDIFGQRGQVPNVDIDAPVDGYAQYRCDPSSLTMEVAGSGSARFTRTG